MMTKFESYPFLEIARTYDVDYGDVLRYADLAADWIRDVSVRKQETMDLALKIGTPAAYAVIAMIKKPVHERRGTPRAAQA
jgi:hypothetical protein